MIDYSMPNPQSPSTAENLYEYQKDLAKIIAMALDVSDNINPFCVNKYGRLQQFNCHFAYYYALNPSNPTTYWPCGDKCKAWDTLDDDIDSLNDAPYNNWWADDYVNDGNPSQLGFAELLADYCFKNHPCTSCANCTNSTLIAFSNSDVVGAPFGPPVDPNYKKAIIKTHSTGIGGGPWAEIDLNFHVSIKIMSNIILR